METSLFGKMNVTTLSSASASLLQQHLATFPSSPSVPNNATNGTNHSLSFPQPVFTPCDNPRNIIHPFVAEVVDLVVYAGILPVLVTCGTVTNIINMLVFARQGLSDRIHLCLFSLALSDTGYLVFVMCGKSYALIGLVDPELGQYWLQRHNGPVLGLYLSCLALAMNVTAIISLERCICILSPLKAAKFFKAKYMKIVLVALAVFDLVVVNVSFNLKFQIAQVTDPLTNTTTYVTRLSPLYLRHRTVIDVLHNHMILVMAPFVSLVIVIVCTTAIIIRLKMAAAWRRGTTASDMTSVEKQEIMLTRMLVTVCCVYIVCMTPFVVLSLLLFSRLPGFLISGYLCNTFKVVLAGSHTLQAINSSINFHIYIRQSSRFRDTLREVFPCLVKKKKKKKGKEEEKSIDAKA